MYCPFYREIWLKPKAKFTEKNIVRFNHNFATSFMSYPFTLNSCQFVKQLIQDGSWSVEQERLQILSHISQSWDNTITDIVS